MHCNSFAGKLILGKMACKEEIQTEMVLDFPENFFGVVVGNPTNVCGNVES